MPLESASNLPQPEAGSAAGQWVRLPSAVPRPVLAVGTELKNTVCFASGRNAWISGEHGDLSVGQNGRAFLATVDHMWAGARRSLRLPTDQVVLAHDVHPGYQSTLLTSRREGLRVPVQHHYAHAVACAMDAGIRLPVVGVVCDGAGFGADGAMWGGEVLLCRRTSFTRLAHLDYFSLPGGDATAPGALAFSPIGAAQAQGGEWAGRARLFETISTVERDLVARQLEAGLYAPPTSSMGRLFDAVAFLIGCDATGGREAVAAVNLQRTAEELPFDRCTALDPYPFAHLASHDRVDRLDWRPMIRAIVADADAGLPRRLIAARFHLTMATMLVEATVRVACRHGVDRVTLSGGCFLNALLRKLMVDMLRHSGLVPFTHQRLSCSDAAVSLGQAVIGAATAADLEGSTATAGVGVAETPSAGAGTEPIKR